MFRLMVVTDRKRCVRPLVETVRAALRGGADAVQLRERDLSALELLNLAEHLRRLTLEEGAALVVNHRLDVALAVEADGVQLGWRSLPAAEARRLAGDRLRIGVSCHDAAQLRAAEAAGADYAILGPVFFTPSKEGLVEPLGLEKLAKMASGVERLPVIAVGGITAENVGRVRATGAAGVAVISAIAAASDPTEAARALAR